MTDSTSPNVSPSGDSPAQDNEIKTETVAISKPPTADKPTESNTNPSVETKTANDGSIPLNQTETPKSESVAPAKAEPIMVTPEDIAEPPQPDADTEKLQEQLESLTGEIQALEAKIERLTSSAKPVADAPIEVSAQPPIATDAAEAPKSESIKPDKSEEIVSPTEPATEVKPKVEESKPSSDLFTSPAPIPTISSKPPFSDIQSKPAPEILPKLPETPGEESGHIQPSALAVISEVLIVLGIILFLLLAATSFFREMAGEDLYQVVKSVGWLTSTITLGLGFLLALFGRVKAAVILLGFFFLLLSAVMLVGINYPTFLGPFEESLGGLLDFYR